MKTLKKSVLSLIVLTLIFMACNNAQKESEKKLHDQVMAIHDEVMPKMGEINALKRGLKAYKDVVPDEDTMKVKLLNTILLLAHTDDRMSDWMKNYHYPNPDAKPEAMMSYLTGQLDTIKDISNEVYMNLAISKGFMEQAPDSIKNMFSKTGKAPKADTSMDHSGHSH